MLQTLSLFDVNELSRQAFHCFNTRDQVLSASAEVLKLAVSCYKG